MLLTNSNSNNSNSNTNNIHTKNHSLKSSNLHSVPSSTGGGGTNTSRPYHSSSSLPHQRSTMITSRGIILFFCCLTFYDISMSYQYGKSMRQLLSSYPDHNSNNNNDTSSGSVQQQEVPYRQRIGSNINRFYYYDSSSSSGRNTSSDNNNRDDNVDGTVPMDDDDRDSASLDEPLENHDQYERMVVKDDREIKDVSDIPTEQDTTLDEATTISTAKRMVDSYKIISNVIEVVEPVVVAQPNDDEEEDHTTKRVNLPTKTESSEDVQVGDDDTNAYDNTPDDDKENDDEPWVLISDTKAQRERQQQNEGILDDNGNEIGSFSNKDILFQEAIQNDAHVSLYRNYDEYISRSQRFPSVQERVQLYMSTWYNPPIFPCTSRSSSSTGQENDNVEILNDPRIHYNYVTSYNDETKESSTTILLRQSQKISVNNHNNHKRERLLMVDNIPRHSRMTFVYNYTILSNEPYRRDAFIDDALHYFTPSLQRIQYPDTNSDRTMPSDGPLPIPILLQVGDSEQFRMYAPDVASDIIRPVVPVIKKFRYSMEPKELSNVLKSKNGKKCNTNGDESQPRRVAKTVRLADNESLEDKPYRTQPIISIMSHTKRHYGPLTEIVAADRSWDTKVNMAVYRGALTGMNKATVQHDVDKSSEEEEVRWCMDVPRCNLVLQHGTSQYVDAKLTKVPYVTGVTEGSRVKPVLNGVMMEGDSLKYNDMLQYKAIIMLEGNDVASGLKWALYSNSVVMMSKPTCTSWAMEELLIPYVHYIPLNDDLSNVEDQVRWMIDHDAEAEQIATNGRLWMTDLIFHPDVDKDTDTIIDETFRRYMQHFYYNPTLTITESSSLSEQQQEESSGILETKQ